MFEVADKTPAEKLLDALMAKLMRGEMEVFSHFHLTNWIKRNVEDVNTWVGLTVTQALEKAVHQYNADRRAEQ